LNIGTGISLCGDCCGFIRRRAENLAASRINISLIISFRTSTAARRISFRTSTAARRG